MGCGAGEREDRFAAEGDLVAGDGAAVVGRGLPVQLQGSAVETGCDRGS